jgi:hypothetical protein
MLTIPVNEGSSVGYEFTLYKEDDEALTLAEINTLTLTLYIRGTGAVASDTVIRDAEDVKNTGGMSIHATTGACVMTFSGDDTEITNDDLAYENHIALFELTTTDGVTGYWEAKVRVKNLRRVP